MLILDAVGLQIRRSGCLRPQILFISALQMLILGTVGLQIRLSDCSTFRSTSGRLQSKNVPLDLQSLLGWICNPTVMSISIFNA